jgi:hypothetical protein
VSLAPMVDGDEGLEEFIAGLRTASREMALEECEGTTQLIFTR